MQSLQLLILNFIGSMLLCPVFHVTCQQSEMHLSNLRNVLDSVSSLKIRNDPCIFLHSKKNFFKKWVRPFHRLRVSGTVLLFSRVLGCESCY